MSSNSSTTQIVDQICKSDLATKIEVLNNDTTTIQAAGENQLLGIDYFCSLFVSSIINTFFSDSS